MKARLKKFSWASPAGCGFYLHCNRSTNKKKIFFTVALVPKKGIIAHLFIMV